MAKDAVDHYPCLHLGGVGQHLPAVDIADGVDARDGGLEVVVDGDIFLSPFLHLNHFYYHYHFFDILFYLILELFLIYAINQILI